MGYEFSTICEKTRSLEYRPQGGIQRAVGVHVVYSFMEEFAAEISTERSSTRESRRRDLPVRRILHRIFNLYLYKIQALYHLLATDLDERQKINTMTLAQMECVF